MASDQSDAVRTLATMKSEAVKSLSDDGRNITKLGDIVSKFTYQPLAQQYSSPERESNVLHQYGETLKFPS